MPRSSSLAHSNLRSHQLRPTSVGLDHGHIVVKMLAAGICGTDIAMINGRRACSAETLGHEGVGVALRAPSSSFSEGTRLVINPVHRQNPRIVIGHSCDGIFRQTFSLDAITAKEGNLLVECPPDCNVSDLELVLAEPVASVLYSFELIRQQNHTSSLIIRGSGTIAILAAKLWSRLSGSPTCLVSKSEAHVRFLRDSTSWPENVRICADRYVRQSEIGGFRSAILACGRESAPDGLRLLLDTVEDGAMIDMMAGFAGDYREPRLGDIELDALRWANICGDARSLPAKTSDAATAKAIYLTGHRGTSRRHILDAIDLLSKRVITLADIPHRVFGLSELPEVLRQMSSARSETKWVKAVIDFSREQCGSHR